jgi:uncharacterized protein YjbJ (UPF0337 family)
MRFLIRLVLLALAAVGAKTLYDRFAPKATELRGPAGDVFGSAKDAARDVTQHAKNAAGEVVDDARQRAEAVREQAIAAAEPVQHDAPTVAGASNASRS